MKMLGLVKRFRNASAAAVLALLAAWAVGCTEDASSSSPSAGTSPPAVAPVAPLSADDEQRVAVELNRFAERPGEGKPYLNPVMRQRLERALRQEAALRAAGSAAPLPPFHPEVGSAPGFPGYGQK